MKHLSLLPLTTVLLLTSCGDIKAPAENAASNDSTPSSSNTASDRSALEKLLAEQLGATHIVVAIHQPEITHLTCILPRGQKHTWVLTVVTHPEQVKAYAKTVEENRNNPGFENGLEQGAYWGHNGEPTLTVIARDNLAFILANHTQLPFHELAAAITDPETGGKWRADAAKVAAPLADQLRKTFP